MIPDLENTLGRLKAAVSEFELQWREQRHGEFDLQCERAEIRHSLAALSTAIKGVTELYENNPQALIAKGVTKWQKREKR